MNLTPQPSRDPKTIQSMFAKVAERYDQANSILSFGIHHIWRSRLVRLAAVKPGERVLDCATGTGDLAVKLKLSCPDSQVIGTDFCQEMLRHAPQKARDHRVSVQFLWADAMSLPFPDESFDLVTISFGIRNVVEPQKALREMARVLKPGGRVFVLEFGQVDLPGLATLYRFYSEKILPVVGGLVTGQKEAYSYLQKTSASFPCGREFLSYMDQAFPFQNLQYQSLSGGIAYLYRGFKPG